MKGFNKQRLRFLELGEKPVGSVLLNERVKDALLKKKY
jgi:hypothetical protein